jgi:hypothetical protein
MCNKALQMATLSSNILLHLPFLGVTPLTEIPKYALLSKITALQPLHYVTDWYNCYTFPSVTVTNTKCDKRLHIVTSVTPCYTLLRLLQMLHPRHLILIINKILYLKGLLLKPLMKINITYIRNNLTLKRYF